MNPSMNTLLRYIQTGLCLLAITLTGCATQAVYQPKILASTEEALKTLQRTLLEQPPQSCPESVEVTTNYFQVKRTVITGHSRIKHREGVAGTETTTIFYRSIGSANLFSKSNWFSIIVSDKVGRQRYRYATYIEDDAHDCINALTTLINAAKSNP